MLLNNLISFFYRVTNSRMTIKTLKSGKILTAISWHELRFRIYIYFILEATIKMVVQSNNRKMQKHQIIVF